MTLGTFDEFGIPLCQILKSLIITLPLLTIGWHGPLTFFLSSTSFVLIFPLARSPCTPSWHASVVMLCVPSHTSVEPFSDVMVTRGIFTTRAKGRSRWSKGASVWASWAVGDEVVVGGSAVLPEIKETRGKGPRVVEVTWVTIGSR